MKDNLGNLQARWRRETELIIGWCEMAFALVLLVLYSAGMKTTEAGLQTSVTSLGVYLFAGLCAGRLLYARFGRPGLVFGWVSALTDIAALTVIIYFFSVQYGASAASLDAPTFLFYFVLIAIHGMRFNPRIVLATGFLAAACWVVMLGVLMERGADITHSYATYFSSDAILVGAEVEKIFALLAFTLLLGFGVKRAASLLEQAAEARLARVKLAETEKATALKSRFLANMSHELRTPMNGLLGMIQMLGTTELCDDQTDYVQTIERSGEALLVVLNDMLDFSSLEMGKLELDPSEFDIRLACRDVVSLMRPAAEEKSLHLRFEVDPEVPVWVVADTVRLRQILVKLVGNAIKFTETGHVTLRLSIASGGNTIDGVSALRFAVEDTGIGLAPETLERIFADVSGRDNAAMERIGEAGLGLSITRGLIKLMNGTMSVKSEEGAGTVFSLDVTVPHGERQLRRSAPINAGATRPELLMVGQETDFLPSQLDTLTEIGCALVFATNIQSAARQMIEAEQAGRPFAIVALSQSMTQEATGKLIGHIRKRAVFDATHFVVFARAGAETHLRTRFSGVTGCTVLEGQETGAPFDSAILSALAGVQAQRLRGKMQDIARACPMPTAGPANIAKRDIG